MFNKTHPPVHLHNSYRDKTKSRVAVSYPYFFLYYSLWKFPYVQMKATCVWPTKSLELLGHLLFLEPGCSFDTLDRNRHVTCERDWHAHHGSTCMGMGLLPDTWNCGLRMCWEYRERFPRHRRHARAVMHVGIANPYLVSGPLHRRWSSIQAGYNFG